MGRGEAGEISGYVRDASGIPQMGAVVEIVGTAARTLTVFTDGTGFYSATDLLPGLYTVKVSVASFLPAWRDKVGLHPGTNTHLNVTLNTLLNGMRVGSLRGRSDDDDWKWTLRSVANRPVLRVFDDPSSADKQDPELKGSLSFVAGSAAEGYGSGSEMSTGFSVERSIFSVDHIGLKGERRLRRRRSRRRSARDLFALVARWFWSVDGHCHSSFRAFRS